MPAASAEENAERLERALAGIATGGVAPAARDDAQGRFRKGDAVGFVGERDRRLGRRRLDPRGDDRAARRGRRDRHRDRRRGAPIPLDEIDTHVPDGVEIETHEGGQPSWWWLLAAQ